MTIQEKSRFRRMAEAGLQGDLETMMASIDKNCKWVLMSTGQVFQGEREIKLFLERGFRGSVKTLEIRNDVACGEWGVLEYINRGTLTEKATAFGEMLDGPSPQNLGHRLGRAYEVPVCLVYHLGAEGRVDHVNEYLDLGSYLSQLTRQG